MAGTPAGDFDYDVHGHGYAMRRRTDPRIASLVHDVRSFDAAMAAVTVHQWADAAK